MKKYFELALLCLVIILTASSCSKDSDYLLESSSTANTHLMLKQDSITSKYHPSIDEYVSTNHPNTSILELLKQDDRTFVAKLADGIELSFDSEGNLIDEEDTYDQDSDEENEYDENDEGESDSDENVTEYPEVIGTYLANNHSNATIDSIKLDESGSYIVVLSDEVEIEFKANGTFVEYLD